MASLCMFQVIEAVFEDLKLKRDIFERLDKMCKPETILCTNTSTLDIDSVSEPDAAFTKCLKF